MQKHIKFITILSFFLFVSLVCSYESIAADAQGARVNLQAIDVADLQSEVEKHKGKVVVVNFFATWCPPCREEIPGLVSVASKRNEDVVVLGISVDESRKPLPAFMEKFKINYPVYMSALELAQRFKVRSIPHNIVYDTKGKVVANAAGTVTEKELDDFIDVLLEQK